MDLAELQTRLERESLAGRALPFGGGGQLSARRGPLTIDAVSRPGFFDTNTSAIALSTAAAEPEAIGVGLFLGNEKDSGSCVASGACALALLESLDEPWLSSADVAPSLRRFVLRANDWIAAELSPESVAPERFPTVGQPRRTLEGIAAAALAVVVRPDRLDGVHVGDGKSYLLRNGEPRALTLSHTLDRLPGFRGSALADHLGADTVVVQVLGLTDEVKPDLFRLPLLRGDVVVLGSQALDAELLQRHGPDIDALGTAMESLRPEQPMSLAVVRVGHA